MWVTIGSGAAQGVTVRLEGERFVVGSGPECHLIVPDPGVAPLHAYFETRPEDGSVLLHDLGSEAGTLVNGRAVDEPIVLEGDEEIKVGDTVLIPTLEEPAAQDEARAAAETAEPAEAGQPAEPAREPPGDAPGRRRLRRLPRLPRGGRARSAAAEEHRRLRRWSRAALGVGGGGALLALLVLVLLLTDVIGGGDDRSPSAELASAVERATPSTVIVTSRGPRSGGQGSGWVLDAAAGLVATNFHVVNGGDTFRIGTADGMSRDAKLFAAAPCDDLALLRVSDRSGLRTLALGSQSGVEEGEQVAALGFPLDASPGDDLTSTVGVVSVARDDQVALGRDAPPLPNAIGTDALITPGSSGGPLVDAQGRLVGQNTGGLAGNLQGRPVQGQGYAIGVDRVKEVAAVLREGRSQGWTGMSLVVLSRRELARNRLPEGIAVTAAVPGSPAAAAGIGKRPLVLTEVDGVRLRPSLASYCRVAGQASRGDSAVFSLVAGAGARPRDVELDFK